MRNEAWTVFELPFQACLGGARLLVTTQRRVSRKERWSKEEEKDCLHHIISRLCKTLGRLGECGALTPHQTSPAQKGALRERSPLDTVPESRSGSLPPCPSPPTAPGVAAGLHWQPSALGLCWCWPVRQTSALWPVLYAARELLGPGKNIHYPTLDTMGQSSSSRHTHPTMKSDCGVAETINSIVADSPGVKPSSATSGSVA